MQQNSPPRGAFLLNLFGRLPLNVLRASGSALGLAVFYVSNRRGGRRQICEINAQIFFPEKSKIEIELIAKNHLVGYGQALLDRLWLWFAPQASVFARLETEGLAHYQAALASGKPVVLFVPHFLGLDAAWPALNKACAAANLPAPRIATIFQPQASRWQDALFRFGRGRFGDLTQFTRHDGIKPIVAALRREGRMYYCLPDNDFGLKDAQFVPFFGEPAATVTVLPRLVGLLDCAVLPMVCTLTPRGYHLAILPTLALTGVDIAADLAQQNALIEAHIAEHETQYLLSHRRYKTRPAGAPPIY